jgi:hypothetical protein
VRQLERHLRLIIPLDGFRNERHACHAFLRFLRSPQLIVGTDILPLERSSPRLIVGTDILPLERSSPRLIVGTDNYYLLFNFVRFCSIRFCSFVFARFVFARSFLLVTEARAFVFPVAFLDLIMCTHYT